MEDGIRFKSGTSVDFPPDVARPGLTVFWCKVLRFNEK